jgi:hypothetical protein
MQRPTTKGATLRRTMARETKRGRLRLHHWLRDRYAELASAKAELKPTWDQFANSVAAAGAKDAKGNAPHGAAVRKAWLAVEAEMGRQTGGAGSSAVAAVLGERQPAPLPPTPPPVVAPHARFIDRDVPPATRPRVQLRSARPIAEGEAPIPDGSRLPRPLHPKLKNED